MPAPLKPVHGQVDNSQSIASCQMTAARISRFASRHVAAHSDSPSGMGGDGTAARATQVSPSLLGRTSFALIGTVVVVLSTFFVPAAVASPQVFLTRTVITWFALFSLASLAMAALMSVRLARTLQKDLDAVKRGRSGDDITAAPGVAAQDPVE